MSEVESIKVLYVNSGKISFIVPHTTVVEIVRVKDVQCKELNTNSNSVNVGSIIWRGLTVPILNTNKCVGVGDSIDLDDVHSYIVLKILDMDPQFIAVPSNSAPNINTLNDKNIKVHAENIDGIKQVQILEDDAFKIGYLYDPEDISDMFIKEA